MRNPAGSGKRVDLTEKIEEILRLEGWAGLISMALAYLKKIYFTGWYRLRLKSVGSGSFFTGKVEIRGGQLIEIGAHCLIEEGAVLWASPNARLQIGQGCFVGRGALLKANGRLEIGRGVYILKGAEIQAGHHVILGQNAWIARDCKIMGDEIEIQKDCILGPDVILVNADHRFDAVSGQVTMSAVPTTNPIQLEEGCWVGARSVILKGVTIGKGAVIGAGAVVNKSILPYEVAVGVPAKAVKKNVVTPQ